MRILAIKLINKLFFHWWVVVERSDHDLNEIPSYYFGPFTKKQAWNELISESDETYWLLTQQAKDEDYIAEDAYMTKNPPSNAIRW